MLDCCLHAHPYRHSGHGILWEHGLHHRDISVGNLMYGKIGDHYVGVLNDFDLAILHDDKRDHEHERTGTIPFMAYGLLENLDNKAPIPHMYGAPPRAYASSLA
jgi:hypothetical protein